MPSEKYFELKRNIPTDPVAVYEHLVEITEAEQWHEVFGMDSSAFKKFICRTSEKLVVREKELEPYREIQYNYSINDNCFMELGFQLEPNSEGTMLTCYIQRTDLAYPFERWESLFMSMIMGKYFNNVLSEVYFELVD